MSGSYRRKKNPPKPAKQTAEAQAQTVLGYHNPGVEREIHTDRLTSGLPYQRPVNHREVDRLIRE